MRKPNFKLIDAVKDYLEEKCGAHGSWQESIDGIVDAVKASNPNLNVNRDNVYRAIVKLEEDGVIEAIKSASRDPNTYVWKAGMPTTVSESTKQADDSIINQMIERLAYYRQKVFQLEHKLKVWEEYARTIEKKDRIGDIEVIYRRVK